MLGLLRRRNFFLLWLSGFVSLTGSRMLDVALPYYIYQQTHSTLATAMMVAANLVPHLVLGSFAGVLVDRSNRKRMMVVTNILQAATVLLLLGVSSPTWLWLVYVVAFLQASLSAFFAPAEGALLPSLVAQDELFQATSLGELNNRLARLLGAPLGGVVLGLSGLRVVVIIDCLTFLIAALLIAWITTDEGRSGTQRSSSSDPTDNPVQDFWSGFWREWLEGIHLVIRNRVLATLFLVLMLMNFGGIMIDPLYPAFVEGVLGAEPQTFGWLKATHALGGILSSLLLVELGKAAPTVRLLAWGSVVGGVICLIQFNLPLLPVTFLSGFVLGFPSLAAATAANVLVLQSTPEAVRGRILGALGTTVACVSLASVLGMSGALGEVFGIVPMLNVASGINIMAGLVALKLLPLPRIKHLKTEANRSRREKDSESSLP